MQLYDDGGGVIDFEIWFLLCRKLVGESATALDIRWDFKLLWGQLNASVLITSRDPSSSLLTSVYVVLCCVSLLTLWQQWLTSSCCDE